MDRGRAGAAGVCGYPRGSCRARIISAASRSRRRFAIAISQPAPIPATPMTTRPIQKAGDHIVTIRGGPTEAKNFNEMALFWGFRAPGTRSPATEIVCVPDVKFHASMWTVNPSPAFRYGTVMLLRILGTPATVSFTQTEKLRDTFSSPAFLIDASIVAWKTSGFEIGVRVMSTARRSEEPAKATTRSGDDVPA